MVDQKNVLTKCLLLLEKCPWNGTWVKPFHSGNVHRDAFFKVSSKVVILESVRLLTSANERGDGRAYDPAYV